VGGGGAGFYQRMDGGTRARTRVWAHNEKKEVTRKGGNGQNMPIAVGESVRWGGKFTLLAGIDKKNNT